MEVSRNRCERTTYIVRICPKVARQSIRPLAVLGQSIRQREVGHLAIECHRVVTVARRKQRGNRAEEGRLRHTPPRRAGIVLGLDTRRRTETRCRRIAPTINRRQRGPIRDVEIGTAHLVCQRTLAHRRGRGRKRRATTPLIVHTDIGRRHRTKIAIERHRTIGKHLRLRLFGRPNVPTSNDRIVRITHHKQRISTLPRRLETHVAVTRQTDLRDQTLTIFPQQFCRHATIHTAIEAVTARLRNDITIGSPIEAQIGLLARKRQRRKVIEHPSLQRASAFATHRAHHRATVARSHTHRISRRVFNRRNNDIQRRRLCTQLLITQQISAYGGIIGKHSHRLLAAHIDREFARQLLARATRYADASQLFSPARNREFKHRKQIFEPERECIYRSLRALGNHKTARLTVDSRRHIALLRG